MDVDYLREALRADAQLAGEPEPDLYERVRARRQRSDRRRLSALAAGLAALLVGVAVPAGLSLSGNNEDQNVAGPSAPEADIFGVPTRGSLANDTSFLDAVRRLSWEVPGVEVGAGELQIPNPPVETRSVVFAGDVAAGRWALVVGPNTARPTGDAADPDVQTDMGALSDIAAAWFVGPPGATPEQMLLSVFPRGIAPDQPASLYDGASGALVVVAAPGDDIEISARPEVAADATVSRSYLDAGASGGVAVAAVETNPFEGGGPPAVQYRVTRAGAVVAEQIPDGYSAPAGLAITYVELDYLRQPVETQPGDPTGLEQEIAARILSEYGLRPDQLHLQVHYVGPLPGVGELPAGLTVVTATFPSGAVLTRAEWKQQDSAPQLPTGATFVGGQCTNEMSAAGLPAAQRVIALRCDVRSGRDQASAASSLVVLSPPELGGSYATVEVSPETFMLFMLSEAGVAMAQFPDGAQVVLIHAADGTILSEVPISAP